MVYLWLSLDEARNMRNGVCTRTLRAKIDKQLQHEELCPGVSDTPLLTIIHGDGAVVEVYQPAYCQRLEEAMALVPTPTFEECNVIEETEVYWP